MEFHGCNAELIGMATAAIEENPSRPQHSFDMTAVANTLH